jgi:uncharacterized repeat protein (TIGR02543 family)
MSKRPRTRSRHVQHSRPCGWRHRYVHRGAIASDIRARLLIVLIAASGCVKQPTTPPSPLNTEFTEVMAETIGPLGGTLSVRDPSSVLFGTRVVVPPAALSIPTRLAIGTIETPPEGQPGLTAAGQFVELRPEGTPFAVPVAITLPVSHSLTSHPSDLAYTYRNGRFWVCQSGDSTAESHGQSVQEDSSMITFTTTHFSGYQSRSAAEVVAAIEAGGTPPGSPIQIPIDVARCIRCDVPRRTGISTVIIHSTNNPTSTLAREATRIWNGLSAGHRREEEPFFATYYIDAQGRVVQLVAENVGTSHASGHNPGTIGIELLDAGLHRGDTYSVAQTDALRDLVDGIMGRYGLTRDAVKRHKDYPTGDPVHDAAHADPYFWSDMDWVAFKASLVPPVVYTLRLATRGSGSGRVSASPPSIVHPAGRAVILYAVANSGSTFTGWSGGYSGAVSPAHVTMDGDKTVTASFTLNAPTTYNLTLGTTGSGSGTITADPAGPSYIAGESVTLSALADPGSTFAGWFGDQLGTGSSCVVTMDSDKTVTAKFDSDVLLLPATITRTINCVLDPPPSTGPIVFAPVSVEFVVSAGVAWNVTIPTLPESGDAVTVVPSSGVGPTTVSVTVSVPDKHCQCPCSLRWASGPIAEFRSSIAPDGAPLATLLLSIDHSSCECRVPDGGYVASDSWK